MPQSKAKAVATVPHYGALAEGAISLTDLLVRMTDEPAQARVEAPAVPEITAAHRDAFGRLLEIWGKVAPKGRRKMNRTELPLWEEERRLISELLALLAPRKDAALREYAQNHLDLVAEATGLADPDSTPRDAAGHYLVETRQPIPGTSVDMVRELSGGKIAPDSDMLAAAVAAGHFTPEEYRALTTVVHVRVFSEAKARQAALADPTLITRLARHAMLVKPRQASIRTRPTKTLKES